MSVITRLDDLLSASSSQITTRSIIDLNAGISPNVLEEPMPEEQSTQTSPESCPYEDHAASTYDNYEDTDYEYTDGYNEETYDQCYNSEDYNQDIQGMDYCYTTEQERFDHVNSQDWVSDEDLERDSWYPFDVPDSPENIKCTNEGILQGG